jgi:hypothetical protein
MSEVVFKVPSRLRRGIREVSADESSFIEEAVEEKLSAVKLERSKAFRKLLVSVFSRMTGNSKLSDEDCIRLGREVNGELARKYGLTK